MIISSEKAFDLLPYAVDVFDKLELQDYIKKLQVKSKGKNKEETGIELVKYIVKNSSKIKEEFFNMVAILDDKPVEEIKGQNIMKTITTFKEMLSDKELMAFFTSAMK